MGRIASAAGDSMSTRESAWCGTRVTSGPHTVRQRRFADASSVRHHPTVVSLSCVPV
jgi:hypothetical protein